MGIAGENAVVQSGGKAVKEADSTQSVPNGIRDIMSILKPIPADMLSVVMVEARLFGCTVLAMFKLCVVIGLLLIAGWLFAGTAAVVALESLRTFNLIGALAVVSLFNLMLAALFIRWLGQMARDLTFRDSRVSVNALLAHARSAVNDSEQERQQQ